MRDLMRLLGHGVAGAVASAAILAGIGGTHAPAWLAAVLAPAVFASVAQHYFLRPGARAPVSTALAFAAILASLQLALHVSGVLPTTTTGLWLPVILVAAVTCVLGALLSPRRSPAPAAS
jgi:hypothetical protein